MSNPVKEDREEPESRFRLIREIGRGGMGVVYEAQDLISGRKIALKVLSVDFTFNDEAQERFFREARLAASISHPNCVFVYGAYEVHGSPAIAMELMSGHTLEDHIVDRGAIPVEIAVEWIIQTLRGLEAAHRQGVIHRDIKPGNCFVTENGHIKLGDFGLSRMKETDLQITRVGAFVGTPMYSSPEQIKGKNVDFRVDLYSIGATLYTLLTGKRPFDGEDSAEIFAKILTDAPPPPRRHNPEIPKALEEIVLKAMHKDPARRFVHPQQFQKVLEPFRPAVNKTAFLTHRFLAMLVDGIICLLLLALDAIVGKVYLWGEDWIALGFFISLFLYFSLAEGIFGQTVGKWFFGLQVVSLGSGKPSLGRAFLRSGICFGGLLLLIGIVAVTLPIEPIAAFTTYALFPFLLMSSARFKSGYRGLHEIFSGTRVIQRVFPRLPIRREEKFLDPSRQKKEGTPERIGPYPILGCIGSTPYGALYLSQDLQLHRKVWIHQQDPKASPFDPSQRKVDRPARVWWLEGHHAPDLSYDVYVAPSGASLAEYIQHGWKLNWHQTLDCLNALSEELGSCGQEEVAWEQLWIDEKGELRVVDFPIGAQIAPRGDKGLLCRQAARTMLGGTVNIEPAVPEDLPFHSQEVFDRLTGHLPAKLDFSETRRSLASLQEQPVEVSSKMRSHQIMLSGLAPTMSWCVVIFYDLFDKGFQFDWNHILKFSAGTLVLYGLISLPFSILFTGGLSMKIIGIGVRNKNGKPASRLRCALRSLCTWLPANLIYAFGKQIENPADFFLRDFTMALSFLLFLGGVLYAIRRPKAGLQDLIAGTRLVPR